MKGWGRWFGWLMVGSILALGCGAKSTGITITISPTSANVLLNNSADFTATVSGSSNSVVWAVNGVTGGNSTVGTITSAGYYTAPAAIPPDTVITVYATVSGTNPAVTATATITLSSGITAVISPTSPTVATGETLVFSSTIGGVPFNAVTSTCNSATANSGLPLCTAVTWSVTIGGGTINSNTGVYTAPSATGTATVTATSVYDSTITVSSLITIVAVSDPTLTSVSPKVGAIGSVFEDIYLTGTNFISTTNVFVNGVLMPASAVEAASTPGSTTGTALRVRVPDTLMSTQPTSPASTVTLSFTASRQNGSPQQCSPDPTQCQVVLSPVRAAIVGTSPDSVHQAGGASVSFNIDGGFFGSPSHPTVTAQFDGQPRASSISSSNPDRQLSVTLTSTDLATPGLFPVSLGSNSGVSAPPVVANLAVQPAYGTTNGGGPSSVTQLSSPLPVGMTPAAVAINTATGIAVVANQGSDDVTLIDLTQSPPAVVVRSLCTGAVGLASPCPAGSAAPTGVAVDNVRNIALVANSANDTVAVIDLNARAVAYTVSTTSIGGVPASVGINPVTGRALVAYRGAGNATLLDLTPWPQPPAIAGSVSISTGGNPRVAVSPNLNWAVVTPGGLGSLAIVDLSLQTVTPIVSGGASRSAGTVTITTAQPHTLETGETVLIEGVADTSFNGITTVASTPTGSTFTYTQSNTLPNSTSGGGEASYAQPVATEDVSLTVTGVGINNETGKVILADPFGGALATIFNLLNQSSASVTLAAQGFIGAAMNPLDNTAVAVNETNNQVAVIDPTASAVLTTFTAGNKPWDVAIDPGTNIAVIVNQADNTASVFSLGAIRSPHILQSSPSQVTITSTLSSPASPLPQTLTIIGKGFTPSSVATLDGTPLTTLSVSDRVMTVNVPAAMQTAPRRYTLEVDNSGTFSNASSFTVEQSVDVSQTCATSSPLGVAIDMPNNLALVSDTGCSDVYVINLATGMGQIVAVGTAPEGVAVQAQGGLAAVANTGANTVSVINDVTADIAATIDTDPQPDGVAIDSTLGDVLVTAAGASSVDLVSIIATNGAQIASLSVQQSPGPVSVDSATHLVAVGNEETGTVSLLALNGGSTTLTTSNIAIPQGIAFDPVSSLFLVAASLQNQVDAVNETTAQFSSLSVGINPTSLAYNFETSTLVTTNSLGQSMSVVDLLSGQVSAVFRMTSASQFAVGIHPLTNLAVVADSTNQRVLLLPLPR